MILSGLVLIIALIVWATIRLKVHPIFSLTIAAILSGFLFGLAPDLIAATMASGFGKTLSGIGLVIAFGTVIGTFLEKTNGTKVITKFILKLTGLNNSALAINFAGFVVSIPVFCDSGFVILSSLNKTLSKKTGKPLLLFAIALASGLMAAHVFVPPTPGPLAAAAIIGADLGSVLTLGLLVAIPVSLAGYVWARLVSKLVPLDQKKSPDLQVEPEEMDSNPTVINALLPLLVPILLIAFKSISEYPTKPFGEGITTTVLGFLGNPIIALFIGVLLVFSLGRTQSREIKNQWVTEGLKQAGVIVLITGAGGAFGAVLRTFDIASELNLNSASGIGGLLLFFGIAALLKTAQGSSTVAIITTASIAAPLLNSFGLESATAKVLAVLAVGAGAITVSHVNDSYFWVVSEFSGLTVKQALKSHTIASFFQGLTGILIIILLFLIL